MTLLRQLALLDESDQIQLVRSPFFARDEGGTDEWYTPGEYVEAAREVMGGIDLDPASNPTANLIVRAAMIHTKEDSGLAHDWFGRVWLNPPYSGAHEWINHLLRQYVLGNITQAIMTIYANTDTIYFQQLWQYTMCFPSGRIKFWNTTREGRPSTKGSVFVYLGQDDAVFREVFGRFGPVGRLT